MIAGATPPPMIRSTPVAGVIGDQNNANSTNTTSHTGMIALRLNSIDMVVTLLSFGLLGDKD
jgi:hypothetical protein